MSVVAYLHAQNKVTRHICPHLFNFHSTSSNNLEPEQITLHLKFHEVFKDAKTEILSCDDIRPEVVLFIKIQYTVVECLRLLLKYEIWYTSGVIQIVCPFSYRCILIYLKKLIQFKCLFAKHEVRLDHDEPVLYEFCILQLLGAF